MKSFALTTALSLAMAGSTLAVPMMQQGHAIAHINAEALKNNLAMAKANTNMNTKRQTTPATSPAASVPAGTVPSVALTDLDRVVSSVGVIVKNAQDDFQKIDIKDPQGITGILSQLLGNVTQTVQQGTRRIKANQKAAILPVGAGWGVAGGAYPLGVLGGHLGGLGGLGGLLGVTDGLAGLTGVTGLLSSLLNTVTGLLGNLLQLGGGDATSGSGLDANTLASLANLQALLSLSGGLTGGVPLGTLPLGDLSNLAGILSPELLNQLLSGTATGSPLSVIESLLEAVQELLSSVLSGSVGVTAAITGDLGADASTSTSA
ncbi:hypothetical protein NEUTE1DRAFT_53312 [Neurospora tetrasperma FGSC 2508]|uniref:Uncharacterized protein n=1 Tax=Neurospora tetrasperma (strain FGSC 2508 / ATCC MYA-4615 / P0657) TaxID=510951 RepID=F8N033_NEUT8|nr:uncharacterized protein NEUTE1DRAFT_53312 [Neurospora tetrasperma FGSC 2508]EGO53768.1 hypothetical protein NEUTE1DRAFT_53312 [Neurospora tetrasperma FGSC 2508]EGZ76150.1 hypothetical protein NEUTE2DRAFT_49499 [Neurospora tetrasperma FGSC 2509]